MGILSLMVDSMYQVPKATSSSYSLPLNSSPWIQTETHLLCTFGFCLHDVRHISSRNFWGTIMSVIWTNSLWISDEQIEANIDLSRCHMT